MGGAGVAVAVREPLPLNEPTLKIPWMLIAEKIPVGQWSIFLFFQPYPPSPPQ
jgi:hypothetical protein